MRLKVTVTRRAALIWILTICPIQINSSLERGTTMHRVVICWTPFNELSFQQQLVTTISIIILIPHEGISELTLALVFRAGRLQG